MTVTYECAAEQIRRFGIELEMCDPVEAGGTVDCYCGNNCCSGSYEDEEGDFGEIDLVVSAMNSAGLVGRARSHYDLHEYHCNCDLCDHNRVQPWLTAQQDCTVGVEFVSRITRVDEWELVTRLEAAVDEAYVYAYLPSTQSPWGNHVHVDMTVCGRSNGVTLWSSALFASEAWDWERLSAGGRSANRGYNPKPDKGYTGRWVAQRETTVEYRLWNTPSRGKYVGFHVAASLAIARWAWVMAKTHDLPECDYAAIVNRFDDLDQAQVYADLVKCWPGVPGRDEHIAMLQAGCKA